MDELTFQHSLRQRPPADPHYRLRLSAEPGVATAPITTTTTTTTSARTRPLLVAARLAVAGVIVALFGGALLVGVLTAPTEDSLPAASASPTPALTTPAPIQLPKDIPADVRSGTLETLFGPARWVHLTGDETSLPRSIHGLLSTQGGYVVPDFDPRTGTQAGLWRSPDLLHWTLEEPLGVGVGINQIWQVGDTYWVSAEGDRAGASLWWSPDTQSWEQVSLEGLTQPGPDGYAWFVQPGQPVTHEGVTIVPITWGPDHGVVFHDLPGIDDLEYPVLIETAPGVFDVRTIESFSRGVLSPDIVVTLRMEDTELGLRVTDNADGTELMVLEGVSLEFVERLAVEEGTPLGGFAVEPVSELALLDGEALIALDPPLEASEGRQAFNADQDGFVSYTIGADGLVHVHRSQDGREWSETDIIGDDPDEPTGIRTVWAWSGPSMGLGSTGSVELSTSNGVWRISDGRLERVPVGRGGDGSRVANGWIVGPETRGDRQIVFITDEGERASIDLSDLAMGRGNCGASEGLLSANTFATSWPCPGRPEAWILTLDDLTASGSATE